MTEPAHPIFVYGTLLPGQPNAPLWQQPGARSQPAALPGARIYDMGFYPMLVETAVDGPDADAIVRGALLALPPDAYAVTLARLDALEGYDPAQPDAPGYRRVARQVRLADGRLVTAWVYTGQPAAVAGRPAVPGGDWAAYAAAQLEALAAWWLNVDTVAGRHP